MWFLNRLLLALYFAVASVAPQAPVHAQVASPGAAMQGAIVDPTTILNFNPTSNQYYWNGKTTATAVFNVTRADSQIATAQNSDYTWTGWGANTARVATGRGLLVETQGTNRLKQSRVFSNVIWTATNLTLGDAGDNPITGSQPVTVAVVAPGTTSVSVPSGTTLTAIYALGAGGNGANGTGTTNGGGGGGSGGISIKSTSTALGSCSSITVQVASGGSGVPTFLKDCSGTIVASADSGTNASGSTAGTGGSSASGVGTTKRSGASGGAGSIGAGNRGGGGGAGAANDSSLEGSNANGTAGSGGNNLGGGGGNRLGGGVTTSGAAAVDVGGVGGTNIANTGGGTGGTVLAAAGAGSTGGGGGGGLSAVGLNGGAGSSSTWTVTSGAFSSTTPGAGGGGGGGGIGTGNGGIGGLGAGGGGGGSGTATNGTGAAGGDGTLIFVYGAANATRLTATAGNATLTQALTLASFDTTVSLLIRPRTVTGPIYLSADNCVTKTDVRSQLTSSVYQQAYAPYQTLSNPTWCLQIANSGDSIDIDLAQLESTAFPTTPIPTTTGSATRNADFVTLNTGSFPAFMTDDDLTVLLTVYPGRNGTSVIGDTYTAGWSTFSMWGDGSSTAGAFTGSIDDCTPSCGAGGTGNTLNVTAVSSGLIGENCPVTGAGVAANTYTTAQLTGAPNGVGTYSVSVQQIVASKALTTTDGQAYVMNAVVKPAPGYRQNVGTTVVNCVTALNYGFDPQIAQYTYRDWNRFSFTTAASTQAGITSLKGNNELSTPRGSWADPSKFTSGVTVGSQRPTGANPIVGYIGQLILLNTVWPANQVGTWTGLSYP